MDIVNTASIEMKKLLPEIAKYIKLTKEIAAASIEQNSGANQINSAVRQSSNIAQQTATVSEEIATSAEELSSQANQMVEIIQAFKV